MKLYEGQRLRLDGVIVEVTDVPTSYAGVTLLVHGLPILNPNLGSDEDGLWIEVSVDAYHNVAQTYDDGLTITPLTPEIKVGDVIRVQDDGSRVLFAVKVAGGDGDFVALLDPYNSDGETLLIEDAVTLYGHLDVIMRNGS